MKRENQFYSELAIVPDIPSDLFDKIENRLRQTKLIKNISLALAASLVLLISPLAFVHITTPRITSLQPEVASELQVMSDYLNANDLNTEFEQYAVVDGF